MKNINLKQNKNYKEIVLIGKIIKTNMLSILLLSFTFSLLFIMVISEANFPLNNEQCHQVINNTYYNPSARSPATIYNTQVCLSRAGFFNYNGKFTTNYGPITREASDNYMNYIKQQEVKVVPPPVVAPEPARPEEKIVTPQAPVISEPTPNPTTNEVPKPNTEALNDNQNETVKAETIDNADKTTTEPTLSQANETKETTKVEERKEGGTKPIFFYDFIFNSLYLVFALPFVLFAISIALAFKNVFKKNGLKKV